MSAQEKQAKTVHVLYMLRSGEVMVQPNVQTSDPAGLASMFGETLCEPENYAAYRMFKGIERGGYLVVRTKDISDVRLIPEDPEKVFPDEWMQMVMVHDDGTPVLL